MRIFKARVTKYRSIVDTGMFDIENEKTILVGLNEAGKTAVLQALQYVNPPKDSVKLDPLRDYPRSLYNDISTGKVLPKDITVVEAHFRLESEDIALVPKGFEASIYVRGRRLDNSAWHRLDNAPTIPKYKELKKDLTRLCAHVDARVAGGKEGEAQSILPSDSLALLTSTWTDESQIDSDAGKLLKEWLVQTLPFVDEANEAEESR